MEDNYWKFKGTERGGLVCDAKEVTLSHIENAKRFQCTEGEMVQVNITASVNFNTERFDVGWYVAVDGGNALNGYCALKPLLKEDLGDNSKLLDSPRSNTVVGEVKWMPDGQGSYSGSGDLCGDIVMNVGGKGTLDFATIYSGELPCTDTNHDSNMDFGICFSWRQPGHDTFCNKDYLYPGLPYKCFCTRYEINEISVKESDSPKTTR